MVDKKTFNKLLGLKIREIRNNQNLKSSDFISSGIKKATLSNIENGKQQISVYQLLCLANTLNVPANELISQIDSTQAVKKLDDKNLSTNLKQVINSM